MPFNASSNLETLTFVFYIKSLVYGVRSYRDEFGPEVEFLEPDPHIRVNARMYKLNEHIDNFRPVLGSCNICSL
jgi:hypothetical protein